MRRLLFRVVIVVLCLISLLAGYQQPVSTSNDYKKLVVEDVESMAKQSQVMVDMVFSFGELGFHEVETSKYLTGILRKEGFKIEQGIAAFVEWFRHANGGQYETPKITADVFGTAPRELARAISLYQTVEMVRVRI